MKLVRHTTILFATSLIFLGAVGCDFQKDEDKESKVKEEQPAKDKNVKIDESLKEKKALPKGEGCYDQIESLLDTDKSLDEILSKNVPSLMDILGKLQPDIKDSLGPLGEFIITSAEFPVLIKTLLNAQPCGKFLQPLEDMINKIGDDKEEEKSAT